MNNCFMLRLLTEIHSRVHDYFFFFLKKDVGMREDNSQMSSSWNITAGYIHPVKTVWKDSFFVCVRISLGCNQNGRCVYASLRMFTEDRDLFSVNNHRERTLTSGLLFFHFSLELFLQVISLSYRGMGEPQSESWYASPTCQKELE